MHRFTLRPRAKHLVLASALALGMAKADAARAQTSSLFRQDLPVESQPLTLADSSMIYQAQEPLKTIKLNDLVTIIVDEKTQVVSEADIQRR
jgi:flagellar basal body L-ring protein FlgH